MTKTNYWLADWNVVVDVLHIKNNVFIHWWVCKICVYKLWRLLIKSIKKKKWKLQLTGALMRGLPLIHLKEGYWTTLKTLSGFRSWPNSCVTFTFLFPPHLCHSVSIWPFVFVFTLSSFFPPALIFPSAHCCVRSLVDILRHQSSPVQQGERNNTTVLTSTTSDGRMSKNLYTPILQSKDNRSKWEKTHVENSNPPLPPKQTNQQSNEVVMIR